MLIVAASVAVMGLLALFLIRPQVSPNLVSISGEVTAVRTAKGVTFISFVPNDFIVVSFNELSFEPMNHTLHGRLQEYKGKVEFVVESYD